MVSPPRLTPSLMHRSASGGGGGSCGGHAAGGAEGRDAGEPDGASERVFALWYVDEFFG